MPHPASLPGWRRARKLDQGAIAEAKKILLRQGEVRFGSPDARVRSVLEGITDVERLEALGERLLNVATREELLDSPAPRRSQPRRRRKAS
jgi:hypothetical protein